MSDTWKEKYEDLKSRIERVMDNAYVDEFYDGAVSSLEDEYNQHMNQYGKPGYDVVVGKLVVYRVNHDDFVNRGPHGVISSEFVQSHDQCIGYAAPEHSYSASMSFISKPLA